MAPNHDKSRLKALHKVLLMCLLASSCVLVCIFLICSLICSLSRFSPSPGIPPGPLLPWSPLVTPLIQQRLQVYRYDGDPATCWTFIQDCAGCLDLNSSEFNKVSFMVLCLGGKALRWAASYLDLHPIEEVSFWPFAKDLLLTFGSTPPPPPSIRMSTTRICQTSLPSPGPDSATSPSPVGRQSSSPSISAGAIVEPPMGRATTPPPGPVGIAGVIPAPPRSRARCQRHHHHQQFPKARVVPSSLSTRLRPRSSLSKGLRPLRLQSRRPLILQRSIHPLLALL
ncbi:uncharacterized protein [Nothobranchius furzeri]|uniref:uncharacterized protein n=1 Tax=Nothobranchius furzeri TaxID=105023 RepID=UPI003904E197